MKTVVADRGVALLRLWFQPHHEPKYELAV